MLECSSAAVQRWGRERTGTQRYRCFGCRRTFNDPTRTAMSGTHLPEKWQAYADIIRDGLSTRRAGERIDVDHKTAWRWRHKVMAFWAPAESPPLSGIVEADETYFRHNFKGATPVGRRARKRGTKNDSARGLGKNKVPVVVARALPVTHIAQVTARNERKRGIYHVQTLNSCQGRLKSWSARFCGFATKYLPRYLTWHTMDARIQRLTAAKARAVCPGRQHRGAES